MKLFKVNIDFDVSLLIFSYGNLSKVDNRVLNLPILLHQDLSDLFFPLGFIKYKPQHLCIQIYSFYLT